MRKLYIYIVIVCYLFVSCKQHVSESADYPVSYIINYDSDETFDWYSHMDIEKVILLESSDSSIISLVRDCQIIDDKILIQDYKQHVLFVYNHQGKLLYSIKNIGNGPGEYLDIRSFCLSFNKKEIIINDGYKLLFYNLIDGKYLHSIPLDLKVNNPVRNVMFSSCINPLDSVYYLWTDMGDHTLYKYNGKEMTGLKPRTHYQLGVKKFIINYEGDYLYCPDYGEFGVSKIDGTKCFYINFGDKVLPEELLPVNGAALKKNEKEPYFKAILNVQETKSGIYVSALSPQNKYYEIYIDKTTGKILKGHMDTRARLNIVQIDGDSFYALFYPFYVDDESPLRKRLSNSITFDDNPILIKFRMKM